MTRIDLYVKVADPLGFACRLIDKVYRQGEPLLVLLDDDAALQALDTRLWCFSDTAFVPHGRYDDPASAATPVQLIRADQPLPAVPLLLNLSGEIPSSPERFARILEVSGADPNGLQAARRRYAHYRDCGFDIQHHDMS